MISRTYIDGKKESDSSNVSKKISEYMSGDDFDIWMDDLSFNKIQNDDYTEEDKRSPSLQQTMAWIFQAVYKFLILL